MNELRRGCIGIAMIGTLAGLGCSDPSANPAVVFTERDSAGVRIVVNGNRTTDTVIVGDPVLMIGSDGDPRYEFYRIDRVLGLSDGRIVVADKGSQEIRYYSAQGEFQVALGGKGEGPGEFVFLFGTQRLSGDTVVVGDVRAGRVQFFSPEPSFVRGVRYAEKLSPMPTDGTLCAGPIYVGVVHGFVINRGWSCLRERGVEGWVSYVGGLEGWRPSDDSKSSFGRSPTFTLWERPGREIRDRFPAGHFPVGTAVGTEGDYTAIASTTEYRLDLYRPDGQLVTSIRDSIPLTPVSAEIRQRFWETVPEGNVEEYEGIPFLDSLPAFDRVRFADERYWVRYFPVPGDRSERWAVFEATGEKLAVVRFPPSFSLSSVYASRGYGTITDDFGVERVQVYAMPPLG